MDDTFGTSYRFRRLVLVLLLAASCRGRSSSGERFEALGDASVPGDRDADHAASDAASMRELCGSLDEACCSEPLPACGVGLRCDVASGLCAAVAADARVAALCQSNSDCGPNQSCCPAGFAGHCEPVEPAACALPDLRLVAPLDFGPRVVNGEFASNGCDRQNGCQCELQRGCVTGPGKRRLLSFVPAALNIGAADLILGDPQLTPSFDSESCWGEPYVDRFLRYELLDSTGAVRVSQESRLLSCAFYEAPYAGDLPNRPRFGCGFHGLQAGAPLIDGLAYSAYYSSGVYYSIDPQLGSVECGSVDITDMAAGDYTLRVSINPEHALPESNYDNNSLSMRLSLPALDDPLQSCPPSENPLFDSSASRECGWSSALPQLSSDCSPGESVTLGCPTCDGEPVLRACDGTAPCTALTALAFGFDTYRENGVLRGQCIESSSTCEYVSTCPTLSFACPASGVYSVYSADEYPYYGQPPAECVVKALSAPDAGVSP